MHECYGAPLSLLLQAGGTSVCERQLLGHLGTASELHVYNILTVIVVVFASRWYGYDNISNVFPGNYCFDAVHL